MLQNIDVYNIDIEINVKSVIDAVTITGPKREKRNSL